LHRLLGREAESIVAAHDAVARSPNDVESLLALVNAVASNVDKLDADQRRTVANGMAKIRRQAPQYSERLYFIEIAVIASFDKAAAANRFEAVLAADPPPAEDTLLRLAAVASAGGF